MADSKSSNDENLKFTQADFQDPSLLRVNRIIGYLFQRRTGTTVINQAAPVQGNTSISSSSSTSSGGGVSGAQSHVLEIDLIAPSTLITSPTLSPAEGDLLTVRLTQDAIGGRQITFDSGPPAFKNVTVNDVAIGKNKVSMLNFICCSDGNWWLKSFLMGRIP